MVMLLTGIMYQRSATRVALHPHTVHGGVSAMPDDGTAPACATIDRVVKPFSRCWTYIRQIERQRQLAHSASHC